MNKLVSFFDKQANELKHELAARNSLSLARQVENNEPNFTHLEIHAEANVTTEGMEMIAQALPMNRYITHVSFKNKSLVGTSVVQKMAEFTEMTICLTHLRLADCKGLDNDSATSLLKSLENNVSVQQLAIPGNDLSCGAAFGSLLQHNYTLQAIDVSRNQFGSDFEPVLAALSSISSANLKGIFMTENDVQDGDIQRAHDVLEKHPKSATTLLMLQFLPLIQGAELPLQRDLNDLLHFRIHGDVRPPLIVVGNPNVDEAVAKAKQVLNNVAQRARTTSFQKQVQSQSQPAVEANETAVEAKSENSTQTSHEGREVCIQTCVTAHSLLSAAAASSGAENEETFGAGVPNHNSRVDLEAEIHGLRDALTTERLTRATLTETLQNELESERANSARLAAENEMLYLRLNQQSSIVVGLKHESNEVFEELRGMCTEAYAALTAAFTEAEQGKETVARVTRESRKMLLAMRTTRSELDAVLTRQSDLQTRNCDAALASCLWRPVMHDVGCSTDLTIGALEAHRLSRLARHEHKRQLRIAQQMEEMRKKGPVVDTYAITLASELEAIERAKARADNKNNNNHTTAAKHSETQGSSSPDECCSDDDMTFVFLGSGELDPTFAEMTKDRWANEKQVPDCMACTKPFGVLKRKHHCRRCGKVFCDKCCPVSNLHKVRICVMCLHPSKSPPRTPSPSPSNRGRKM